MVYCLHNIVVYRILSIDWKIHRGRRNKGKFLRMDRSNEKQVSMHSLTKNRINPPHCVLVLIGYRIDLLLFVPTNRIVQLLLTEQNKY